MLKRLNKCARLLAATFVIAAGHADAAEWSTWQGAFQTTATWGAMELQIADGEPTATVRLRLAPDARPSEPEVRELRRAGQRISFATTLQSTQYRFDGTLRGRRWSGTVVAADGAGDRGTWTVSHLDVEDPRSSAREPLPAPTGRYRTGRIAFDWVDENRPELETRATDDHRELLVYVFFPSAATSGAQRVAYMPEANAMRDVWKEDLTRRLTGMRAHSRETVALAGGRERFPIVIFAPGGGQKTLAYTTLLEDLASHGYVVAAIEPPYNAPAMQFPDGRVIRRLPPAERGWEEPKSRDDAPRIYEQMVVHWARDMSFVLDKLSDLNAGAGPFSRRLAIDRVGALGHSRGGQAAGTVRLVDSRFRGGVNLDGNIRGRGFQPIAGLDGGRQPFLWVVKQSSSLTNEELAKMELSRPVYEEFLAEGDRLMRSVRRGSATVTIARIGIDHMDFSDIPLWEASLAPDLRAGKLRTASAARRYVLAFFRGCLQGRWSDFRSLVADPSTPFPEASTRQFGTMWPP
jgi:dienelactone hydrolase